MTATAIADSIPDDWVVSHDELVRRLRDPAFLLVDVLSPESYAGGHIPGAINLPLGDLRELARTALPDFDREIVVYCSAFT